LQAVLRSSVDPRPRPALMMQLSMPASMAIPASSDQTWLMVRSIESSRMLVVVMAPGGSGVVSMTSPPVVMQTASMTLTVIGSVHRVGDMDSVGEPVGDADGVSVGSEVGVAVGPLVGLLVGLEVGPEVGLLVGLLVGPAVGLEVGPEVGLLVGLLVGPAVGLEVGLEVGPLVGLDVGPAVGLVVGVAVGDPDG